MLKLNTFKNWLGTERGKFFQNSSPNNKRIKRVTIQSKPRISTLEFEPVFCVLVNNFIHYKSGRINTKINKQT